MRIIIIADYAIPEGGAPQVAIASAIALAALGHDVTYVHGVGSAGDPGLEGHPNITRIGLGGADIWSKNAFAAAKDGIWNREPLAKLAKLLADHAGQNAIVHVHQWTKYFSPSLFSVIRRSGLPLAVSLHDYFLVCPTGLMYRFDRQEPCALTPMSGQCLAAPCDPRSYLHKGVRVLRAAALNRALKGFACSAIHVSPVSRQTIGHWLPAAVRQFTLENPVECQDKGMRSPGPNLKVTYCGRLTPEKGADLVALAARDAGLPSLFIGEGPLREKILAIDPSAEITGWLDKTQARARIERDALAIAAPSRWPETGPLVVAEAMSCGVPAVVSNRAGAAGRVTHGVDGLVCEPDAGALAAGFRTLAGGDTAARLGAGAYASFWRHPPAPAAHAAGLVAIYEETIG